MKKIKSFSKLVGVVCVFLLCFGLISLFVGDSNAMAKKSKLASVLDMTGATLEFDSYTAYLYDNINGGACDFDVKFKNITGVNSSLGFSYTSSNSQVSTTCTLTDSGTIHIKVSGEGETDLSFVVSGTKFDFHLNAIKIGFEGGNSRYLVKGKKLKLIFTGYEGVAEWTSSNPEVATVSSKGKVKGLTEGNTLITANIGEGKVFAMISVVKKTRLKCINKAIKIGATCKYSQPKRMKKKFYDCSSLVWKAYSSTMKKYFGRKKWAPTAADNALWCKKKGRLVSGDVATNVQNLKYIPGALMYETSTKKNGRYKGIYHVEMFTGYTIEGYDEENEKPIYGMMWANRTNNYYSPGGLWSQP